MGLVNTGIKKYPCVSHVYPKSIPCVQCISIYCCIFNVVGLYFCWRSWTSCLDTWHHWFYQIPTDKNQKVRESVRNLIMGHVWIFQPDNNPKTTQKWVTGHKTKLLIWPFQSSDLNPVENEWGELKRRSTVMELLIWRIWSDSGWRNGLWSLVRCSLTSAGIIGENSYTILSNGGFKKYWIKGYR